MKLTASLRSRLPPLIGAVVCGVALFCGRYLQPEQLPIPRCTFLRITGYPCPFCGTTRSFFASAKGAVGSALREAPLGVLVYAVTWGLLVWLVVKTIRPGIENGRPDKTPLSRTLVYGVLGLIIASWIYRLAMGYQ